MAHQVHMPSKEGGTLSAHAHKVAPFETCKRWELVFKHGNMITKPLATLECWGKFGSPCTLPFPEGFPGETVWGLQPHIAPTPGKHGEAPMAGMQTSH
jgi:hypothetical protein